jgi:hypothetical protein
MRDVIEEQAKNGDGDSITDAIKSAELDRSLEESLRDHLDILIKNEGPEVSDCENNGILLKKGLAPEVYMLSVPSDWTPPIAKAEKGEPAFESVDNPGQWPEFTYRSKFLLEPRIMLIIHSLLEQDPCQPISKGSDWLMDECFIMRNGRIV